jgi:cytoskeletal protein CcmA (bactofilin family)
MSPSTTSITAQTTIKGELRPDGPAVIAGRIHGNIAANDTVELTAEGTIDGHIQGTTVAIHGTVKGNITASQACRLGPTARVAGDICTANLAIAEGARFIGHVCVGEIDPPAKIIVGAVGSGNAAEMAAPVQVAEAAPEPTVQILSENVQAALRRGPRIIKAR